MCPVRFAAAQIAGWKARLAVGDLDVATALLDALEPLGSLAREVARGRRQLAMAHAAALEQQLAGASIFRTEAADDGEAYAVAARLRLLAGR